MGQVAVLESLSAPKGLRRFIRVIRVIRVISVIKSLKAVGA